MKKKIIILLSVVIILLMGIVVWFNIPLDLMDFCLLYTSTRTLSRKESGSSTNCMVDGTGLEPVTSCTSSRCSTS